jgi:hypothetical protein
MKTEELLFAAATAAVFVSTLLESLEALHGFRSTLAACQHRK